MPARSGASSSSMHTTTSLGSSWLDGSPSRQSPSRLAYRPRRETLERDSPSRQIQHAEFNLMLNRSERSFYERLDLDAAEQAREHDEKLTKAAIEHERIQKNAKLEIQRILLQQEQERKTREEAQLLEIERLKREKARQEAEAQQRRVEAKRQEEEAARQAAERQRQLQEVEARIKAQKDQAEAAQKQQAERADAARKAQETAAAAQKAQPQTRQPLQPTQAPPVPLKTAPAPATTAPRSTLQQNAVNNDLEEIHTKYLALHKRMKEFWQPFKQTQAKKGAHLKEETGNIRRELRTRLGQISIKRDDSRKIIAEMRKLFDLALSRNAITVDIRPFIISEPVPQLQNEAQAQYPALLLYAFICFTKALLAQFESESDGKIIQEGGLIAASLFADQKYMWNGIPMTDILLAKYHRACPILFGIRGAMDTGRGQARLGWAKIHGTDPDANTYNAYMLGLACGFAALSLRKFSGKTPAIPCAAYWLAVSSICNTPTNDLYGGHFMVLKGLLRDSATKFIDFYGVQAKAVLRKATITLPARAPARAADTASLVSVLRDVWVKDDNLSLD